MQSNQTEIKEATFVLLPANNTGNDADKKLVPTERMLFPFGCSNEKRVIEACLLAADSSHYSVVTG